MTLTLRWLLLCIFVGGLNACAPGAASSPAHPQEAAVREAVVRYFDVWSKQDMDAYEATFHPQARIFYLPDDGAVVSQGLTDFVHGQRMSHAQSKSPMKEAPDQITIQMDDKGAQALVTWILTKDGRQERGTDLFTFKRQGNDWKIVSLVFYGE